MFPTTLHQFADKFREGVSYLMPTPTKSQFIEKGQLSPQEFLEAGDQLVFKFPTWQWSSADPKRQVPWLLSNKQYIITRNVPCRHRVKDLEKVPTRTEESDGDGWMLPGDDTVHEIEEVDAQVHALSLEEERAAKPAPVLIENFIDKQAQEAPVISDFDDIDKLVVEDDPVALPQAPPPPPAEASASASSKDGHDAACARTRTYDLTITYDKYYMTPRLWIFGYDESGRPLKPDPEVFEDIMSEYKNRTVTVEPHPLTGLITASIHPCKHSEMMKRVVDAWIGADVKPRHDLALFVFLKFMASVIPTINYDFTMDAEFLPSVIAKSKEAKDEDSSSSSCQPNAR